MLAEAIEAAKQTDKLSVSLRQRRLRIGYSFAVRLMEMIQEAADEQRSQASNVDRDNMNLSESAEQPDEKNHSKASNEQQ
jgi:DNA segregation ATPase FtsK/SpoIIIE-like protein